jgi:diguanylate cyclase (GGDEF)-like protein
MKLTRTASTWARVRHIAGTGMRGETTAAGYLAEEAKRDMDPFQAALYDPVTGLPERALLLDRIALAMARARRGATEVAMLLLTIDDLDELRERLGVTQGDRILREVGERIARAVRDTDTVARFGPAEFAVLCEGVAERDTLMVVAGRVASGLAQPFPVRFGTTELDIGMEVLLVNGETPPLALLDMAEEALRDTHARRAQQ